MALPFNGELASWAKSQAAISRADPSYVVPSFQPSTASVSTPSLKGADAYGNALDDYFSMLNRTASENSAFNASQAALQRSWQEQSNAKAMDFNASQAALNRDWQAFMSNTAHQREVADLKAAGLNPVLSAMNGNGAAVTSGATASGVVSSGASASADTSANAAIVGILSAVINAQQQLEAANINARTQEAVADKYTAMNEITSRIAAAASMYGSQQMAGASMYGAEKALEATKYGVDNPNSVEAVLSRLMAGMMSDGSGSVSGAGQSLKDLMSGFSVPKFSLPSLNWSTNGRKPPNYGKSSGKF